MLQTAEIARGVQFGATVVLEVRSVVTMLFDAAAAAARRRPPPAATASSAPFAADHQHPTPDPHSTLNLFHLWHLAFLIVATTINEGLNN